MKIHYHTPVEKIIEKEGKTEWTAGTPFSETFIRAGQQYKGDPKHFVTYLLDEAYLRIEGLERSIINLCDLMVENQKKVMEILNDLDQ